MLTYTHTHTKKAFVSIFCVFWSFSRALAVIFVSYYLFFSDKNFRENTISKFVVNKEV